MDEEAILDSLKNGSPNDFVNDILFGNDCWLFEQRGIKRIDASYAALKGGIADTLGISSENVCMIGSGKLGFSLAPGKFGRKFRLRRSDIDLVIVSAELFNSAWDAMLLAHLEGYPTYIQNHAEQIFCRFLIFGSEDTYKSTYLRNLAVTLAGLNRAVNQQIIIPHRVNYRIYRDWDDAEAYHVAGIEKIRRELS